MRFGVLGPLSVWADDGEPVRVPELKVRALLADLLVHEGRPVPADRLADDLWGEDLPGNPANTLQTKVSQLRRVVGRDLVQYEPAGYVLRAHDVDALAFARLLTRARAEDDPRARAALLADALSLWRGPAYADFRDEEFARAAAARLDEQRLTALEEHAEVRLALGEHTRLADELSEPVAGHPLRERLRAVHLRALYRAGRQTEALAGYTALRERLADELGVDPGPELVELYQSILRQDPALAPAPTPATSSARPRTNLPTPLTPLIGRETAVAQVRALLSTGSSGGAGSPAPLGDAEPPGSAASPRGAGSSEGAGSSGGAEFPGGAGSPRGAASSGGVGSSGGAGSSGGVGSFGGSRLVTLTGPGGVGKTRLALAAASSLENAWLVELAGLSADDPATVAEVVADVLDVRDEAVARSGRAALPERLAHALSGRELLLVLDNCEHLVEPVAELVNLLLRTAPGLRVLATSQELLAIPGEAVYPVTPLATSDALSLFAARAGVSLDAGTMPWAEAICRRLDGLPLALELAAARVRALGVQGVAEHLDDRFRLLSGTTRGLPARQRTLRAVIDWSWEQLTPPQREALSALAVHPGGCTLEAAGIDAELVDQLVNRSMVVAEPPRYRLLESIAAYCLERLAPDDPLFARRDAYYTDLADRARPHLYGHAQREWLARLDEEMTNLRAVDTGERLAWYLYLRGRHTEAYRLTRGTAWEPGFAMLLGLPYREGDGEPDARSRWFTAHAHLHLGDVGKAGPLLDGALADFRASGDRWGEAAALMGRAKQAIFQGEFARAGRSGVESLEIFTELGDQWGRLQANDQLGYLAEIGGDYARAAALHREGLRIAEDLRLWTDVSYRLSSLGRIALLTGELERSREFHERGMRLAAEQSNRFAEEFARVGLGLVARRSGDLDEAERLFRASLEWNRRLEADYDVPFYGVTLILAELGFAAESRGAAVPARELHEEGLRAARALGDPRSVALALEGLAGVAVLEGDPARALGLLDEAAELRASVGAPLPPAERGDVNRIRKAATR
ncbi:AfsR/SARP family transcriptional regulator [Nonomuraea endophytica]|uniref:AfsR/SARP family transcriptional regulator n=1 Tax=Nonomuraea endophytica TaxID=714136 RepID=UPI0037C61659